MREKTTADAPVGAIHGGPTSWARDDQEWFERRPDRSSGLPRCNVIMAGGPERPRALINSARQPGRRPSSRIPAMTLNAPSRHSRRTNNFCRTPDLAAGIQDSGLRMPATIHDPCAGGGGAHGPAAISFQIHTRPIRGFFPESVDAP